MVTERGLETKVILDGRVSLENVESYGADIVDIFVGGTTCVDRRNIAGSVDRFCQIKKRLLEADNGCVGI